MIEIAPYFGRQTRAFVAKEHDAVPGHLMGLLERNRILIELHSDDLSSAIPRPFDPADLRLDPVEAWPGR